MMMMSTRMAPSTSAAHRHARDRIRESGGEELVERLEHLDARFREAVVSRRLPRDEEDNETFDAEATIDFDVVLAGGGLWSILAPILARRGLRVAVVERARTGVAHREWNASRAELQALVDVGLVDDVEDLIVARYREGTCFFHRRGAYPVRGVLDHAVDAGKLLAHARALGEKLGVTYLDRTVIERTRSASRWESKNIAVEVAGDTNLREGARRREVLVASVLVDARGASSPYSTADLVCPTVGGVMSGFTRGASRDEIDPDVGQILATIDPIDPETRRQHVWEAFPGRDRETTVYLFYYARRGVEEHVSLLDLFARFFRTLPEYKQGGDSARMLRPTFGFIPGWSRLCPASAPPRGSRIILVGDAAARHSPLTYCGFGAMLRSIGHAADAITSTVAEPGRSEPPPAHLMHDAPIHAFTGALAHILASRRFAGHELNELLDAAFSSLYEMGDESYGRLLRDEMTPAEMVSFLASTAKKHPAVWRQVWGGIGLRRLGRWTTQIGASFFG